MSRAGIFMAVGVAELVTDDKTFVIKLVMIEGKTTFKIPVIFRKGWT